jgi:hypothetical protein
LLAVIPERNTVVVMFINNQDADVFAAAGQLLKALQ